MAQATPMLWVVGVHASLHQYVPAQWPVVCVLRSARADGVVAMPVGLVALAHQVSAEYASTEAGAVLMAVAPLRWCTSALVCLTLVGVAASAVHDLRAARLGADGETAGHESLVVEDPAPGLLVPSRDTELQ